jgi:hypothetical protein
MSMVSPSTTFFTVAKFGLVDSAVLLHAENNIAYVSNNKTKN